MVSLSNLCHQAYQDGFCAASFIPHGIFWRLTDPDNFPGASDTRPHNVVYFSNLVQDSSITVPEQFYFVTHDPHLNLSYSSLDLVFVKFKPDSMEPIDGSVAHNFDSMKLGGKMGTQLSNRAPDWASHTYAVWDIRAFREIKIHQSTAAFEYSPTPIVHFQAPS